MLNDEMASFIGDPGQGHMAWAYDALIFGLTEPSEAMVRKMTGWAAHRLGFQANLPKDHPYRNTRPVLDKEDLPNRYVHDEEKWTAWGAKATDKAITRVNAGGPRVEPKGFERVFYDDFRAYRLGASTSGAGDLWVGPGFNTAVGADAPLVAPGQKPDAYPHDAENKKQILSLVPQGNDRWRGSAHLHRQRPRLRLHMDRAEDLPHPLQVPQNAEEGTGWWPLSCVLVIRPRLSLLAHRQPHRG